VILLHVGEQSKTDIVSICMLFKAILAHPLCIIASGWISKDIYTIIKRPHPLDTYIRTAVI